MAEKVAFRGGWTCSCVAASLPLVEAVMLIRGLINDSLDIYQLGWNHNVSASSGTHDRGGCVDVGQFSDAQIAVWRSAGWTMQRRYPPAFSPHAHGYPWGCGHLSPAAQGQATQWSNQQNGLVNRGRVEGPWPVPDYRTGIKRMEHEIMAFKDDVTKAVAAEVVKQLKPLISGIPDATLSLDGKIKNRFGHDPTNEFVAIPAALTWTGEYASHIPSVEAKVDQLLALAQHPTPPVA